MVLNSNQSPSLKVLSSKRHVENLDPNHSAELHPHQKKQAIDPSDTQSFFPLTGLVISRGGTRNFGLGGQVVMLIY